MANSYQRATSDGTMTYIDVSIDYLDRSEISVYFNDVLTTMWAWSGTSDKRILFSPAVPTGVVVMVKRITDASKLRHAFSTGAAFTAQTLDEDLRQALHMAQEASEANLVGDFFTDVNLHGFRLFNVGPAINDTDALTLGQYREDALGAAASADRAEAAASALLTAYPLYNYSALRAYTGTASSVQIVAKGIAGTFAHVPGDTSPDNGGTVIVDSSGRRWRRVFEGPVYVTWFGADSSGQAYSTAEVQAAFTWVAAMQAPTIGSMTTAIAHVHFPQGIYKLNGAIAVRGYIVITGTGTGYISGTTVRQTAADTDIFRFYGETASNRSLGSDVRDINFEFTNLTGALSGWALKYPALSDIDGLPMNSNSHYVRNCRFGGANRFGRFAYFESCNDVELSGNVIDVILNGYQAVQLGTQARTAGCSDVRILGNNFFQCDVGILVCNARAVTITGNNFSNQQNLAGRAAVKLATDTVTEHLGYVSGVTITGNTFWAQYCALWMGGSAIDTVYANNTHMDCLNLPIAGNGTQPLYRYKIMGNSFHLANGFTGAVSGTYPATYAPIGFFGPQMSDSDICDNTVDANGLNGVVSFMNEQATTGWLSAGMTMRNNRIVNNTSYPGRYGCFVPTTAKELVVENSLTSSSYPTNLPVLTFTTTGFAVGDSVTFELDYEVVCERTGVNVGLRTGTVRVAIARLASSGIAATKSDVTVVSSIGDDLNGAGGTAIPTVTFAVTPSPNPFVGVTVTSSIGTPVVVSVKLKAHSFRGTGQVQIKPA